MIHVQATGFSNVTLRVLVISMIDSFFFHVTFISAVQSYFSIDEKKLQLCSYIVRCL